MQQQYYLYTIVDKSIDQKYSIVGVIDGSGSMSSCWDHLCRSWNNFIGGMPSAFCIQFDDTAELQPKPQLVEQKGENTNISLGFLELIKLVKSNKLQSNVIVVFITDGVGEDKVEDYIHNLAKEFEAFHEQGYQFKFFTLAVGEDFSHTIVAELKNRIHNSTLISSQMEYIQDPSHDFEDKLNDIKEEVFYKMMTIAPAVSLVPNGKKLRKLAPNQTIVSTDKVITVNGEKVDLSKCEMTFSDLNQLATQILLKLMEDSTRGLKTVKQEAKEQLDIIKYFLKQIKDDDEESKNLIQETMQKIQSFASGQQSLKVLSAKDAAQSIAKLQINLLKPRKRQDNYVAKPVVNEAYEKAVKRLSNMKKLVKIKLVYPDLEQFFQANNQCSPELLVKLCQEKKGGLRLQTYALEYSPECKTLFELLHICQNK